MAEVSSADEGMTVADVGTGFVAAGLAPRVKRVLAVGNSPAMMEVARKNLAEMDVVNVELLEGDIGALPLETGFVDATFANMVLHHAEDPTWVLGEMARVVKPGGVVDEVEHAYAWMREEHADVWLGFDKGRVEGLFRKTGLTGYGYESLGMQ